MQFIRKILVTLLTKEAQSVLKKYNPKILVVTGSVGKTSTKDAIASALEGSFRVAKSKKSYNSDIGVPLTILQLENPWSNPLHWILNLLKGLKLIVVPSSYPEWLVLEVGADKPGDLAALFSWIQADVVVVTRIPKVPVHVAFYESPEAVFVEETIPVHAVKSHGLIVLNNDEEAIRNLKHETTARVLTYGTTPGADIYTTNLEYLYDTTVDGQSIPSGITFFAEGDQIHIPITLHGVLGVQHVYPILAALAAARGLGVSPQTLAGAFYTHETPPGRMKIIDGIKGSILIDDTYNASPIATETALQVLKDLNAPQKIAVLGDMKELGTYSKEEHLKIGTKVAESADILLTVGYEARLIAEGALDHGMSEKNIYQFDDAREAGKFLERLLEQGTIALIKGSQSIRMERTVEEVMLYPEQKESLLVRQEPTWQKIH